MISNWFSAVKKCLEVASRGWLSFVQVSLGLGWPPAMHSKTVVSPSMIALCSIGLVKTGGSKNSKCSSIAQNHTKFFTYQLQWVPRLLWLFPPDSQPSSCKYRSRQIWHRRWKKWRQPGVRAFCAHWRLESGHRHLCATRSPAWAHPQPDTPVLLCCQLWGSNFGGALRTPARLQFYMTVSTILIINCWNDSLKTATLDFLENVVP